jgi:hypothetical protein
MYRAYILISGLHPPCFDVAWVVNGLYQTFSDFTSAVFYRNDKIRLPSVALADTVRYFRRLLGCRLARAASVERVIGLVGEGRMLRALFLLEGSAWQTWNGPVVQLHGLLNSARVIEAEAALHSTKSVVDFSRVDRLYLPPSGELHLMPLEVVPVATGSLRVLSLAELLRAALADPTGLYEWPGALGYHPALPKSWVGRWFALSSPLIYFRVLVFPRLVRVVLLPLSRGILRLRYQADLPIAAGFRITGAFAENAALHRLLRGTE